MASPMRAMRPRLLNMIQVQSLLKTMAYGSSGRWSEELAMRPPFVRSLGGVADESQTADFSVKEGWDRARSRKLLAGWTVERERPCRLACLALQFVSHRLGLVTRLMMKRPAQFAYQAAVGVLRQASRVGPVGGEHSCNLGDADHAEYLGGAAGSLSIVCAGHASCCFMLPPWLSARVRTSIETRGDVVASWVKERR